jgi:hypothetical protein
VKEDGWGIGEKECTQKLEMGKLEEKKWIFRRGSQ